METQTITMEEWAEAIGHEVQNWLSRVPGLKDIRLETVLIAASAVLALLTLAALASWIRHQGSITVAGLSWRRQDFVAGWLITGGTGSGKTISGVMRLLHEVFRHESDWGGLVIDDKGHFHESLMSAARRFGREEDVIILRLSEDPAVAPATRFNLIGNASFPAETYARMIVDTAVAMGHRQEQSFFRVQTRDQIAAAIKALRLLNYDVTIENVHAILLKEGDTRITIADLRRLNTAPAHELAQHFEEGYLNQPAEQLGGVRGSIANYLSVYLLPEVADVFCRDSTFSFDALDEGKILCVALPQRYAVPRRYLSTFLKQLFYHHALSRYDLPQEERYDRNLLVLLADEAQHFVTDSEEGVSDYNVIDRIREVNATVVMATQSIQSFIPPLGREKAEVVRLNLRNRLIFQAATEPDATDAADFLGKRMHRRTSVTVGGGRTTRSYSEEPEHKVKPHLFRQLKNHQCYVVKTDKRYRKRVLPPLMPDGRVYPWFAWWRRFVP